MTYFSRGFTKGFRKSSRGIHVPGDFTPIPPPTPLPGNPTNLQVTMGVTTADLSWTEGADTDSHQVRLDEGSWVAPDTNTTHEFTGLTAETGYDFWVRGVNAAGVSSGVSITDTTEPEAPANPFDDALAAYLIEGDETGTNLLDYSGNEKHAAFDSGDGAPARNSDGYINHGGGSTAKVVTLDPSLLTGVRTIIAVFNRNGQNQDFDNALGFASPSVDKFHYWRGRNNANNNVFRFVDSDGNTTLDSGTFPLTTWRVYAQVLDFGEGEFKWSINKSSLSAAIAGLSAGVSTAMNRFILGAGVTASGSYQARYHGFTAYLVVYAGEVNISDKVGLIEAHAAANKPNITLSWV